MAVSAVFKTDMLATIPSLRAFAVSLTQNVDKADDLVQETLVKAWDKHASFQPGTNLKAWLFTILRNEFYSQMRKRGREIQFRLSNAQGRCKSLSIEAEAFPVDRRKVSSKI